MQRDEKIKDVGALIFENLFRAHPEALQLFPFKDDSEPNGINAAKMRMHSLSAFTALGNAIAGLDDLGATGQHLKELVWCATIAAARAMRPLLCCC
jgi:hypothetical protein